MPHDTLYMMSLPGEAPLSPAPNRIPVRLSYRVSPELRLLRLPGPPLRSAVMAITCGEESPHGDPASLCRTILREYAARGAQGLLLDFDHPSPDLDHLAGLLSRRAVPLILPEWLADRAPNCRVLISSALSGGSLEVRLSEAVKTYGADRVILALERCAEEFPLPCPSGCGRPLSPEELERLTAAHRPHFHFSSALCTRYFVHCREDRAHLVLWDDDDTLREKHACARRCGVYRFSLLQRDKSALFTSFSP